MPRVPQKRKEPPAEDDFPPGTFKSPEARSGDNVVKPGLAKGEYETGRVVCEGCGEGISFRDDETGTFTVKHWDTHRLECPNAAQQTLDPALQIPETTADPMSPPQAKRRRAKRTEEERIDYLRTDPYVAQFEPYRVLCASCDKWIRLRPNSTYCSIPWDAHRKSCLAKRVAKNTLPGDDRTSLFSNDPYIRKFDSERIQCKNCDSWIGLGNTDNISAIQTWIQHRATCLQNTSSPSSAPVAPTATHIPTIDSVPPPSKHLMALVNSSAMHIMPGRPAPASNASISSTITAFKDYNPSNFPPAQESRRRNAEQRAAALRSDPLISEVEPNRVFCSLCQKWVQLRQDSSYCAYPWLQHRGKCLNRQVANQKRVPLQADQTDIRFQKIGDDADSEDLESEEGVESGDDDEKRRRRAARKEEKKKAKDLAKAGRLKKEEERRANLINKSLPAALAYPEGDEDAEGEPDLDYLTHSTADLDSPPGRLEFTFRSIRYLFRTTYEPSDELTIATLVTYLNAAMPPDKHEDYDTTEVTKAAMALHERGDFVFEGDVLRIPD